MTKNIIFPLNNKGGVGKTSVLVDLISALAQRHRVGVIDFDDQASLGGTLLGNIRPTDGYEFTVSDVVLTPATQFAFLDPLHKLVLDVASSQAHVAVFPPGTLYDHPEKRGQLEEILTVMQGDVFLAADLPPVPHAGMIFDYTLGPLIDLLKQDVRLFPLLVATPDHNVIDIALRGFAKAVAYFESQGISAQRIHPIFVLNKTPLNAPNGETYNVQFDPKFAQKLIELGILYQPPHKDTVSYLDIQHSFVYEGKRFRSVVFPHMHSVQDGRFSLLFGNRLELYQYPHLVDIVKAHKFETPEACLIPERVYTHALRLLVNYLVGHSGEQPHKNYVKRIIVFDPSKVKSQTVTELRQILNALYHEDDTTETDHVKFTRGGSSSHKFYDIPNTLSLDGLAEVVYDTQRLLAPSHPISLDEIRTTLNGDDSFSRGVSLRNDKDHEILIVEYPLSTKDRISIGFLRKNEYLPRDGFTSDSYLAHVEFFLQTLDRALTKK